MRDMVSLETRMSLAVKIAEPYGLLESPLGGQLAQNRSLGLSAAAEQVLEAAWRESLFDGPGRPVDSADLLVGLLQNPSTQGVIERQGITIEQVRRAKRRISGSQIDN